MKIQVKKLTLALILLTSLSIPFSELNAQHTIRGQVTDQDNQPLAGTNIFISELNKGTVSDINGNYSISNLPGSKIKIQFTFLGYSHEIRTIDPDSSITLLDVTLVETPIETEEIVVTGGYNSTQHEHAVKIDALKLKTIQVLPSSSLTEMVSALPGVGMISKGNGVSKPVIRGLSMDNVLVLNNGVRNENYQYSDHHPLGVTEFGIDDVEVIKGPASLLYGSDAIGGVINFLREKPAPVGEITGDYHLKFFTNTMGISNNIGINGSSKSFFGGVRAGNNSHADFLQGGGSFAPNTRFNETSVKAYTGFTSERGIFRLNYDYMLQNLGLAEEHAAENIDTRGRKNEIWYQQFNNHLIASQNKIFLNRYKIELNASYQSVQLIHYAEVNETEVAMRLQTLTGETKLYLPSGKNSDYIIGLQGLYQENLNVLNAEEIVLPDATTGNIGFFGLFQQLFFNRLRLQAGMRYDLKNIKSQAVGEPATDTFRDAVNKNYKNLSGSAGLVFNFTGQLLVRGNFALAYRTPNLAELTSGGVHELRFEAGDDALVPQLAREADLSLHYHINNFTFDIAGFYNRINHYIYIAPTGDTIESGYPVYQYRQAGASLFGGEAGIHFHPQNCRWLHFESTYSQVTGKQENGQYLPFIPSGWLSFGIQLQKEKIAFLKKTYIGIKTVTTGAQNNPAPEEEKTSGYTLVNLTTGGEFDAGSSKVYWQISVSNLFDTKYISHLSTLKETGFLNAGRDIIFSIRLPFHIKK
ncbi:MAG: TonB-dependent receptor [Bacteroidales bacterium]|nr:TonB-dependent receptor [Bacteroidales bacterium]